jgi:hypothetical protein
MTMRRPKKMLLRTRRLLRMTRLQRKTMARRKTKMARGRRMRIVISQKTCQRVFLLSEL